MTFWLVVDLYNCSLVSIWPNSDPKIDVLISFRGSPAQVKSGVTPPKSIMEPKSCSQIVKTIFGIACPKFHVEFWGNIANKSHHISNIYIITSNPWPRANKARRMELLKVGSARRPLRCGQGTQTEIGTFFFWFPVSLLHGLVMMVSYSSKNQDVFSLVLRWLAKQVIEWFTIQETN